MEKGASSGGLGFWPKAAIWAAVIAIGALYLGSVNHRVAEDERALPAASVSGAPVLPGAGGDRADAPTAEGAASTEWAAAPEPKRETPETPAAVFTQAPSEPAAGGEPPPPITQGATATPATAASETPAEGAAPAASEEVSPAEAEAFAKAVLSEPQVPPREEAAASEPSSAPAAETLEQRRARLLAEYEALRRRAEEESRRQWQGMGRPLAPVMPYGQPLVPGYYPQPLPAPQR